MEEKNEEVKTEEPTTPAAPEDKGLQPETGNQFERADKTVKELKAQNDRREKLIEREEKLAAQRLLGGGTEGGGVQKTHKEIVAEELEKDVKENVEAYYA